jgi:hypothetical protein
MGHDVPLQKENLVENDCFASLWPVQLAKRSLTTHHLKALKYSILIIKAGLIALRALPCLASILMVGKTKTKKKASIFLSTEERNCDITLVVVKKEEGWGVISTNRKEGSKG